MSMRFFNEKQVAEMLGLSVKTLQRWRLFNEGPEWKKFGSAVRYPAQALQLWVDNAPHGGQEQLRSKADK
jgi:predicted DNA-binding transcriptional regulator AlpA